MYHYVTLYIFKSCRDTEISESFLIFRFLSTCKSETGPLSEFNAHMVQSRPPWHLDVKVLLLIREFWNQGQGTAMVEQATRKHVENAKDVLKNFKSRHHILHCFLL